MDVLTLSVAISALPEAMDDGTRVGELGGGAVPPVGRRRHSRESRLAAAAENAGDAQVRASVRNCCNIMRPDSSPRWWRHYRQGWGSWRGGYGHQLHSAAIGALAVPRFLAIEGAHPRASVVAPPVRL